MVQATIPTFDPMWRPGPVDQMPPAAMNTPGGFHSFEHRWAVAQAFEFHRAIGKARIAERIHALNSMAKAEMAKMPKVKLHTPMSPDLSAGIIACEVAGMTPDQVVRKLHEKGIIASVTEAYGGRWLNPRWEGLHWVGHAVLWVPDISFDPDGRPRSLGVPYGTYPRLLLAWDSRETVHTRERR